MRGRYARLLLAFALTGLFGFSAVSTSAAPGDRTLKLYFPHTGERGEFTFKRNGRYDKAELKRINRFLRDWRRDKASEIDPALLDLVWEVYQQAGGREPIHVVSAYRSPATNENLRKRSRGVAKNSQHTHGKAMDFFIPGVDLAKLRAIGLRMQSGGVGYYPTSGSPFVHIDTGSVRHWPRMTRKQLMAVFPSGETIHVPTDGKPLPGYQMAMTKLKKGVRPGAAFTTAVGNVSPAERPNVAPQRTEVQVASLARGGDRPDNDRQTRKWLDKVFSGDRDPDEEEDETGAATAAPATPLELLDGQETGIARAPVPRMRPSTPPAAPGDAPVVVAALDGVPRARPASTPFDITPQERARTNQLAASVPVGGHAGSRSSDDALASLYATAAYEPEVDPIELARRELSRLIEIEADRGAVAAEEPPADDVDDALAGLFATADAGAADRAPPLISVAATTAPGGDAASAGPAIETVARAGKSDRFEVAALAPVGRDHRRFLPARTEEPSIFGGRSGESTLARAASQSRFIETESRSAVAATNAFIRQPSASGPDEAGGGPAMRLAYADPAGQAVEPAATGSVMAESASRTVPQVVPVDPKQPLVASSPPAHRPVPAGPLPPLPRARPGAAQAEPTVVASLPRRDPSMPAAAAAPDVPRVVADADTGDIGTDPLTDPGGRSLPGASPWSNESLAIAGLTERMMAGDSQIQASSFADLRRPSGENLKPMFQPRPALVQTASAADTGWSAQPAQLETDRFGPAPQVLPMDDADDAIPLPRPRPVRGALASYSPARSDPAQAERPNALTRLFNTARSLTDRL